MSLNRRGEPPSSVGPEEHDYIAQVIAEDAAERAPRNRRVTLPPAGDVEVLGWALNDGDEHPIDITLQWGVAKHWPEYATPLVDRAHVTRLTAERDEIRAIKDSAIESVALLHAERVGLLADVKALTEHRDELKMQRDRWVRMHNNLQSELTKALSEVQRYKTMSDNYCALGMDANIELTKARDALAGMVEYFPEGHSDGECFSVERAKAVLAHQSAPAAKGERYECIGKGGDYQVVAIAQGAGTLKGFNHYVYKNADGVHFVRDPEDFLLRMQVKP